MTYKLLFLFSSSPNDGPGTGDWWIGPSDSSYVAFPIASLYAVTVTGLLCLDEFCRRDLGTVLQRTCDMCIDLWQRLTVMIEAVDRKLKSTC